MYTLGDMRWYLDERRREAEQYAAQWLLVQQAAVSSSQRRDLVRRRWLERLVRLLLGSTPNPPHVRPRLGSHL
jgi:hypothetical protein